MTGKKQLRKILSEQYNLICFEDLADISISYEKIYQLFNLHYREVFDNNDRLVFYSNETPSPTLLDHINQAAKLVDISNWFILIVCPGNIVNFGDPMQHINQSVESNPIIENFSRAETICSLPWISAAISPNGDFTPCCVYSGTVDDININANSIEEYYNSQHMQTLRQQFIEGKRPLQCGACWKKETDGLPSLRTLSASLYDTKFRATNIIQADPNMIVNLDLDLGNICNLKCRICNWTHSSLIAAEYIKHKDSIDLEVVRQYNSDSMWIKNFESWNKLSTVQLENLEIEGGEPFFHSYHTPFIKKLIQQDRSHNIRLRFSTNGTIFPEDQIENWKHFKEVHLCFSIDDIGARFEYQRDNAIWSSVDQNLKRYQQLGLSNLTFAFWITVSLQNLYYLPEILTELSQYNWPCHISIVSIPVGLDLNSITKEAQAAVDKKFTEFSATMPELYTKIKPVHQTVLRLVPSDGAAFFQYTKELDSIRQQNFADAHFEMSRHMNYTHRIIPIQIAKL
jgi:MoaA/NifB/PqqE/SkfB family radical SAM enzyme